MKTRRPERISGAASLRAGDRAPAFTLTAADGESVSLAAHLRKGPVILSFLDGWNLGAAEAQLAALIGCVAPIEAQGGALLAIWPDVRPSLDPLRDLRVLHDAGGVVARHYGISAPTTFVIDQASTIVLSLIDAAPGSEITRSSVTSALAALRRIGARRP
jgi:peroxiredoxin